MASPRICPFTRLSDRLLNRKDCHPTFLYTMLRPIWSSRLNLGALLLTTKNASGFAERPSRYGYRSLAYPLERGRGSTVWDEAADVFFDGKSPSSSGGVEQMDASAEGAESTGRLGRLSKANVTTSRVNTWNTDKGAHASDSLKPSIRSASNRKENNVIASWDGTQTNGGKFTNREAGFREGRREADENVRRAGREWDELNIEGRGGDVTGKLQREGSSPGSGFSRVRRSGADVEKNLVPANKERDYLGTGRSKFGTRGTSASRGGEEGGPRSADTRFSERKTSRAWDENQPQQYRGGHIGYRSDRRGDNVLSRGGNGYRTARRGANVNLLDRSGGGERWVESDDEGEEVDDVHEDWDRLPEKEWGRESERTVNWRLEGEPVYGVGPIRAALMACRRKFYTLYVQENVVEKIESGKRKDKPAVMWVLNNAKSSGLRVKEASKHDLNLLVDNRPHQGLVLDASPLELVPLENLDTPFGQEGETPVWLALDEVMDPQNFGAILRSAYFLGATGVVVCAKNSAPLSGVVSKASAGALEVMEVRSCRNMVKFIDMSVENGWRAVGASNEPQSVAVRDLSPGLPTILVLGNEGRGLRKMVKRSCSELVCITGLVSNQVVQGCPNGRLPSEEIKKVNDRGPFEPEIPMKGAEIQAVLGPVAVDSLNVSVAAGILLHDLLGHSVQRMAPNCEEIHTGVSDG